MNPNLNFVLHLSKLNSILSKNFDGILGWLWLNDFIVLHYLNSASLWKLKRIELADKVGMTASGITRLLAPMEKIWLIHKEKNAQDARISYVSIATWGKNKYEEALLRLQEYMEDIVWDDIEIDLEKMNKVLQNIWGKIMWK